MWCDGCGKPIKAANPLGLCAKCEKDETGVPDIFDQSDLDDPFWDEFGK